MPRSEESKTDRFDFDTLLPTSSPELMREIEQALSGWDSERRTEQIWNRRAALWTGADEANWLGWLEIPALQLEAIERFREAAGSVQASKVRDVVLLGMGGSSLCAEVLGQTIGAQAGHPRLRILDSMNPGQIRFVGEGCDLAKTLFVVSSKSGSTLEPNLLLSYFYEEVCRNLGSEAARSHFVAITDPNSSLETWARSKQFRAVHHGRPDIGGRFSALSDFGMIPAALAGFDVERLLRRADAMANACKSSLTARENPGVALGIVLGVLARLGRDKVTIVSSPGVASFGGWVEQLLAESTGKSGQGLIPVEGEEIGSPNVYGDDRLFVEISVADEIDPGISGVLSELERVGHPVLRIRLHDRYDIAREFYRWEFATAVAGAVLGVNPFDQPDVEASKEQTRRLMESHERGKDLAAGIPLVRDCGLRLYSTAPGGTDLHGRSEEQTLLAAIGAHLELLEPGDYFAILPYLERSDEHIAALQRIRHRVRNRKQVATSVGFGPRYLHSTGQVHKGGPNRGVFLMITSEASRDLPIPGRDTSFGLVEAAQALGDAAVLAERGRRVIRVHCEDNADRGLESLSAIFEKLLP